MGRQVAGIKGMRFGHLVVLEDSGERKADGGVYWRCRCDCGNEHMATGGDLRRYITSCGCRGIPKPKRITTHYEGPIVTRDEALARELKRYFTGETCPRGHIAERFTTVGQYSGSCCECNRARQLVANKSAQAAERTRASVKRRRA